MRVYRRWLVVAALLAVRGAVGALTGQVVDPEGQPVAGAQVAYGLMLWDEAQRLLLTTTADAQGRFRLDGVPMPDERIPDRRWACILADAPGWAPGWTACQRDGTDLRIELSAPTVLELPVRDAERRPVAGLAIHLTRLTPADWQRRPWLSLPLKAFAWARAVTDAQGVARFAGLPRGMTVAFGTDDPRYAEAVLPSCTLSHGPVSSLAGWEWSGGPRVDCLHVSPARTLDGVVRFADGRPAAGAIVNAWGLEGSRETRTDGQGRFRLERLPSWYNDRVNVGIDDDGWYLWTRQLHGVTAEPLVVTLDEGQPATIGVTAAEDGHPLADVGVRVYGDNLPPMLGLSWPVRTGADGTLTAHLPAGRYPLDIHAPDREVDPQTRLPLVVEPGKPAALVVKLRKAKPTPPVTVSVLDEAGRPVNGAAIDVDAGWVGFWPVLTGADGRCELPVSGPVRLRARRGRDTTVAWTSAPPGATVTLRLQRDALARVEVPVTDADGRPLVNAGVELRAGVELVAEAATDDRGVAVFASVWPTPALWVTAWAKGYGLITASPAALEPWARLRVAAVALPKADRAVAGWVLDAEGRPVAEATVMVVRSSPPGRFRAQGPILAQVRPCPRATTNAKGEFWLAGLPTGQVMIAANGPRSFSDTVTVTAGDENVVLRLKRP